MPIRQIDCMRWDSRRCLLTRADLQSIPKGSTPTEMINWACDATKVVNSFLNALQKL